MSGLCFSGVIGARFGHFLDRPLGPLARRVALNPNFFTILGFFLTIAAAFVIPFHLGAGGLLILAGGLCDLFDGVLARVNGRETRFGAYLDSLLDRYSDAGIFLSLAWLLAGKGDHTGAFLSIGTMLGALMVSYARARAEGLGIDNREGLMERPERIILLIIATLTGSLVPVLWVMLVLTHATVVQRSRAVWKAGR